MSSCSNAQPYEVGSCSTRKAVNSFAKKISEAGNGQLEPEEDEDEDIDFNPFLKSTPSEASSSLSSEIDGLDADVDYVDNSFVSKENSLSIEVTNDLQDVNDRYSENEEVVMQTGVSIGGACENESGDAVLVRTKKRKLTFYSHSESETVQDASSNGADAVNDATRGDFPDPRQSTIPLLDSDDEDAICKRTRARYSLANFTLDELETYLQESDDSDEFQNVNDEEEYRKFLAAVLQGGDGEGQTIQENENADDDDEDNDADFEIEIEEALESDPDGSTQVKGQKEHYDRNGRRPETRQNRRQKASAQSKEKLLGQARRPLRPLLPLVSNTPIAPFSGFDWQRSMPEAVMHLPSSSAQSGFINGFTPHQIGQLYCLIHEHVQLLIQVFSLCVLEPSRRHIASEVRKLISEMVNERDEVLSWKNLPYPGFCFHPPYIQPSVLDGLPHLCHVQFPVDSSLAADAHRNHPTSNMFLDSQNTSPSEGSHNECFPTRHADPCQPTRDSFWLPFISGPVLSILDVAPLNLVGRYIADVSTALQEYQKRHVEAIHDTHFEREPLFPLPSFPSFVENSCEISRGSNPPGFDSVPSSLPVQQQPKKTLAAALVESTKKQSVALVPKEIVKLAQRFFPLFNTALFPHKPPPAAVANRVLFTDAEDELLALGLMEYNTDWKAIQQRFLPCKTKHQIFVRQKNRCSSKAPENPIKAVRRLKTSPLTAEEKARIHEGLRVLKLDWMSIWKFILPYRDPSLLPRQWRIALGSQKSYKTDGAKKEKRRLYESNRRKIKAAAFARLQIGSEKEDNPTENAGGMNNSGDDYMDDEDGSYVHEAFLADWRPGVSGLMSSDFPCSSLKKGSSSGGLLPQNDAHNGEQLPGHGIPDHVRYSSSYTSNHLVSDLTTKSFKSQSHLRPYRLRRSNHVQVVKLAPDLPPVNLPPSVRVISQFALKNYACQSPTEVRSGCACNGAAIDDMVPGLPQVTKSGISHSINAGKNRSSPSNQDSIILTSQDQGLPTDKYNIEEKGAESDLQMHPLLFQASEDGRLPCYPFNSFIAAANSRNFFSGTQLQANLNFFNEPHQNGPPVDCFYKSLRSKESPSTSCTIDFHPLLQRTDDITTETVVASSPAHPSMAVQSSQGSLVQQQKHANSALTEPKIKSVLSANGVEPASTCERANDLDLEIHLCSTSCKEKDVGLRSRGVSQQNSDATISALDSITVTDKQNYQNSKCKPASYIPSIMGNRQILPGANASVVSSNNISIYADNNVGDPSLPEIVMEQEELSDSDEDGEHVEFEFEEMADTEEEGSDNEQLAGTQNKEVLPTAIEKESISDADRVDLQRETRICSGPQFDDTCTPAKGNTHSWKKGFSGKGREKGKSVQLSLDSCTPACYTQQEPEYTREKGNNQTNQGSFQNDARSRLSRTHRRIASDAKPVSAQTHTQDMLQKLHLGGTEAPSAAPAVRKHKKRICGSNSPNTNTDDHR